MIPVNDLIAVFQQMYREHWRYEWGKHEKGCVDCSGAFVYAYSLFGQSIPNGSNAIARRYTVGSMLPLSQAEPGMAAFKAKTPEEAGYNLPDKYKVGGASYTGDLNDYYHIGLVDADPRYVLNAKGTKQGFCRDALTAKNGWDFVVYLKDVDYNGEGGGSVEVTYRAKVIGGALNIRKSPSTSADRICQIPDGSIITITEEKDRWGKTEYNGQTGWVMTMYLEDVSEEEDSVLVSKKELEAVYDIIGDWLGKRG